MGIDPADSSARELPRDNEREHLVVSNERSSWKSLKVRDYPVSSGTEPAQDELAENPLMQEYPIVFQEARQGRCPGSPAKKINPYRGIDKNQCNAFPVMGRRRGGAVASGILPSNAARRFRAAWSIKASNPRRTAAVFVGALVTRIASSSSSRSISSVVLMHIESHESYAWSRRLYLPGSLGKSLRSGARPTPTLPRLAGRQRCRHSLGQHEYPPRARCR